MKLIAKEGYYYTNGTTIAKTVVMPESADPAAWREITEEEAQELQAEIERQADEENV